jgi:hypothetical protein
MTEHIRIPNSVAEQARKLKDEQDFATLGEAIRHMCQEGDYEV